jgi:hypothetical protein
MSPAAFLGDRVKLLNLDQTTLMEVTTLQREDDKLIIKGTILGSMPITCMLTPQEARGIFKLLDFKTFLFLLSLLFRKKISTA